MKFNVKNIIEGFNKLNTQVRLAIFWLVIVLVLMVDVVYLLMPQWNAVNEINTQITTVRQETQEVLSQRQQIARLRKNLEETRTQFGQLNDKVRPGQELPTVLANISDIANQVGVKIEQLDPDKAHQTSIRTSLEGKYYALPIIVRAQAGYHMFGHFLDILEKEKIFFTIKDFTIDNDMKDVRTHSYALTMDIIIADRPNAGNKP